MAKKLTNDFLATYMGSAMVWRVAKVSRMTNSVDGNPRWRVTVIDERLVRHETTTKPNSMCAYKLTAFEPTDESTLSLWLAFNHLGQVDYVEA